MIHAFYIPPNSLTGRTDVESVRYEVRVPKGVKKALTHEADREWVNQLE